MTEKGKSHNAFIVGGKEANSEGLEPADKYLASVRRIEKIAQQAPKIGEILAAHPSANQLSKGKERDNSGASPPFDPEEVAEFQGGAEGRGSNALIEEC